MIFTAAGTQDGREIVRRLCVAGYDVAASVVSSYGQQLLAEQRESGSGRLLINDTPLDEDGLRAFFTEHGVHVFVDATHPYAVNVSRNAMTACATAGIPYIRFERDLTDISYENVHLVHSYEEASEVAARFGKNIFLTTGSRNLERFVKAKPLADCTLIARVLPTAEVIALCEGLGLTPAQIIAMQGPFSRELNRSMYEKYQADVIITKNSGTIGGTDAKFQAAADLNLPVVVIDRPVLSYPHLAHSYEEVKAFVDSISES
ncbi:precorrin-6A reductase [Selenomonas sp. oral taxon 138]|uniref:precorrin-6A reductase n=1 Tax=Selenomonas sp. oral taxon 138 TaxID=712532 RepID=UPI0002A2EEFE|nr:precorrin-6A reductase [Selenomonas sp. oral taxon 138]EKX99177.1 precorrin-6A reductase [Selenomonas sp. oral taxon 138 str. F0429]